MALATVLLALLFFIAAVSIPAAYFLVRKYEFPAPSDTRIIIRDSGKAGGAAIYDMLGKKTGRNGRLCFSLIARNSKDAKPFPYVAESNKVKIFPKGTWDNHLNYIEILPSSAVDFYANLLEDVEIKNADNAIIYAQKQGLDRQQAHLENIGEGELSRQDMNLLRRFLEETMHKNAKEDKSGRPGSYPVSSERATY